MPWTYRHPEKEWRGFLEDIGEVLGTVSPNVAYTGAEGILHAFRERLEPTQVLEFADSLPSVVRALFLQGWRPDTPCLLWADRAQYVQEANALRKDHNFTGDRVLEAVSFAMHRALGPEALRKELARIGPDAEEFWALDGYDADELAARFR